MSYRTFKHLLGETSLERKCRFIFGGGIFLLVSISFTIYGQRTEDLVIGQTTNQYARRLVAPILKDVHSKDLVNLDGKAILDKVNQAFKQQEDVPNFRTSILNPWKPNEPDRRPSDPFERDVLARFVAAASRNVSNMDLGASRKTDAFPDGSPMAESRIHSGKTEYQYIQAILYKSECLGCHAHELRENAEGKWVPNRPNDLACAVVVKLPMKQTNQEIHKNRAILITAALVTTILALVASWVIVRYVIVKPLKHLRDVSDAIAAGKLNIRSQIQTGDEFEELSHAFNRMLHNLVAMQQELRDVNRDLDRKVDELAQANLALFEMNRLKSEFLATMSHELRTPLNSIIGFSEVLAGDDQLSERRRRYAVNIQSSGKMLLGMINDILDLAKIESGKMEIRAEDFSVRDVCEGLLALARPIAEKKSIDLELRLDEAIPLVRQDPGKIRQIIYNLLSNAVKFTPEGGRVTVTAGVDGRFFFVEVADNGIGISAEDREKIFEKFRQSAHPNQVDGILTREHQGTGLGLSIVRELCRLLGGDVHLDSELGQGSTFTARLPLQIPGNRKFEVNLADERIDLSKARRVEPRSAIAHLGPPNGLGPLFPRRLAGDPQRGEAVR